MFTFLQGCSHQTTQNLSEFLTLGDTVSVGIGKQTSNAAQTRFL